MDFTATSFQTTGQQVLLGSKKNVLLVKDDVGKSKPTTRSLPHEQFTYGKPESKNIESAMQGKYSKIAVVLGVLLLRTHFIVTRCLGI